jgi:hypothetical protein
MGFMFGKSSAEDSWTQFEVALVAAWNAAVVSRRWKSVIWRCKQSEGECLNYSDIVIIQLFSMIYCIGSRCRRVAVLNRKVSIDVDRLTVLFPCVKRLGLASKSLASKFRFEIAFPVNIFVSLTLVDHINQYFK